MNKSKQKFLWGVVNIGQQTEGNTPSDWSRWARRGQVPAIGLANDYFHKFSHDNEIARSIGCNAMRITIEWARIEPRQNEIDYRAIEKYREILRDLKKRNMRTVVGLWHWSMPVWIEDSYGGLYKRAVVDRFERFVKVVCNELGDLIDQVVILNEPQVYASTSYVIGSRPPFFTDIFKYFLVRKNLLLMHRRAFKVWKKMYKHIPVGSTFLWNHVYPAHDSLWQKIYVQLKEYLFVHSWIKGVCRQSDYIGINYYVSDGVFFGKSGGVWGVHGTNDWHDENVWKSFPEGLYHVLMKAKKYKMPLYILENGKPSVAGTRDVDRCIFLKESISYMRRAMQNDVNVHGYFHYSLCDSYEWDSGYDYMFGLVEINRKDLSRRKRESCDVYSNIIIR